MRPRQPAQQLTPREREIALLLADGVEVESIADRLDLSVNTVKVHMTHIRQRLRLARQGDIVAWVAARRVPGSPDILWRADPRRLRDLDGDIGYHRRAEADRPGALPRLATVYA